MSLEHDYGSIRRMATFCGNCKRRFENCGGDRVYINAGPPMHLICADCKANTLQFTEVQDPTDWSGK